MNVLLGICGSISAYKAPWIVRELRRRGASVRCLLTPDATRFVSPLVLQNLSLHPVLVDPFDPAHQEEGSWHVHWARWAQRAVVAPCSANTLARLAQGRADGAVCLAMLSLPRDTPLKVAPAMDPDLWLHPATQRNVEQLRNDGAEVLEPEQGELASGLVGPGRLAEPDWLAEWALQGPVSRSQVLITAGPTREAVDPVRYLTNHSTGKMGYALALEARRRGHSVVLISGPTELPDPVGVRVIRVESAHDMFLACQREALHSQVIIKAAAVADFSPVRASAGKLKKEQLGSEWSLAMQRTPDILAWLGEHKRPGQVLVGFALETDDAEHNARRKLVNKNCDMVVLNHALRPRSGFGGDDNTISLVTAQGQLDLLPMSKLDCARAILDSLPCS